MFGTKKEKEKEACKPFKNIYLKHPKNIYILQSSNYTFRNILEFLRIVEGKINPQFLFGVQKHLDYKKLITFFLTT